MTVTVRFGHHRKGAMVVLGKGLMRVGRTWLYVEAWGPRLDRGQPRDHRYLGGRVRLYLGSAF